MQKLKEHLSVAHFALPATCCAHARLLTCALWSYIITPITRVGDRMLSDLGQGALYTLYREVFRMYLACIQITRPTQYIGKYIAMMCGELPSMSQRCKGGRAEGMRVETVSPAEKSRLSKEAVRLMSCCGGRIKRPVGSRKKTLPLTLIRKILGSRARLNPHSGEQRRCTGARLDQAASNASVQSTGCVATRRGSQPVL